MRHIVLLFGAFFYLFITKAQPSVVNDRNFVIESVVRDSGLTMISHLNSLPVSTVNSTIQYFDGFGRVLQSVQWQGSPGKKDVINHFEYDGFGRESKKYLPYVLKGSADGSYKIGGSKNVHDFYKVETVTDITRTDYPFSQIFFERSPMGRVIESGSSGEDWQPHSLFIPNSGHTVKTGYETNALQEVRLWSTVAGGADGTEYYLPKKLYKVVIHDENWVSGKAGSVEEYKDFDDRLVLKRIWKSESENIDTYYVYDGFGDLRYVIPPGYKAITVDTATDSFKEFVYAYNYDGRRRMVERKVPGKGWEYIVYNNNDQPVLIQNAVQRSRAIQEWSYNKYDAFGRVTENGIYHQDYANRAAAQAALDTYWDSSSVYWESRADSTYSNHTFPSNSLTPLTVYYYDDYGFEGSYKLGYRGISPSIKTKTLATGVKIYKDDGTSALLTINYYDDRARLIQSVSQNHLGGIDRETNTYSFVGELVTNTHVHNAYGQSTTMLTTNEYDHVGRLVVTKHKINAQPEVTLAKNEYNEIGQLMGKYLHYGAGSSVSAIEQLDGNDVILSGANREVVASSSIILKSGFHAQEGSTFKASVVEGASMQHIQYTYNERGWLKSQNSEDFGFELKYQTGTMPQYNGNISEQQWHRGGASPISKTFLYSYDPLNRLKDGNSADGNMREEITYDDMGNIINLKRDNHGTGTTYAYIGNRLKRLTGVINMTTDYTYDLNGNAETDYTGMNFRYNHLNLPDTAWNSTVRVGYLYDALGKKLRKYSNQGGNRDYVDGIEYKADGTIDFIHTGEGVAVRNASNNTYSYRYNITDHLGNVRATIYRNPITSAVENLQQDDYYPFGKQRIVLGDNNKYLYNGKEKQEELNGQYDYGARFYDAEIGRWNVVDPLAEKANDWSPYRYGFNNPIRFIDPTGMLEDDYEIYEDGTIKVTRTKDKTNTYTYHDSDGSIRDLGTYKKRDITDANGKTVEMVDLSNVNPQLVLITNNTKNAGQTFLQEDFAAAFLGAAAHFTGFTATGAARNYDSTIGLQTTQMTDKNGRHSGHGGKLGEYADIRYANNWPRNDEPVWVGTKNYNELYSSRMVSSLSIMGFNNPYSILTENAKGNGPALPGTNFVAPKKGQSFHHKHHMHLQHLNRSKFK